MGVELSYSTSLRADGRTVPHGPWPRLRPNSLAPSDRVRTEIFIGCSHTSYPCHLGYQIHVSEQSPRPFAPPNKLFPGGRQWSRTAAEEPPWGLSSRIGQGLGSAIT